MSRRYEFLIGRRYLRSNRGNMTRPTTEQVMEYRRYVDEHLEQWLEQQPDGQVFFYFSTVREGLKKAFISIPSRNLVMPLDRLEAEARSRRTAVDVDNRHPRGALAQRNGAGG